MFKKILIPVDGSELALKAASTAVNLAKEVGAEVVFLNAMTPYIAPYAAEVALMDSKTQAMFEKSIADGSSQILDKARKIADAAGVVYQSVSELSSRPELLIERTVKTRGCDLIVLATHGRGAIGRFVMGSVTTRLLPISPVPVLIYRDGTMVGDTESTTTST